MKKLLMMLLMLCMLAQVKAQFSHATLQATGLTCAMCSNAINKALQKLPFIATVRSDIKNSAFSITFKPDMAVNIDAIRGSVVDAGFSVGSLKLSGNFDNLEIANEKHVKIGSDNFLFLKVNAQTLNGENTLTIIDKSFMTSKEFKKYSTATKLGCLQSGKAEACCVKYGISIGTRIYHVTI